MFEVIKDTWFEFQGFCKKKNTWFEFQGFLIEMFDENFCVSMIFRKENNYVFFERGFDLIF